MGGLFTNGMNPFSGIGIALGNLFGSNGTNPSMPSLSLKPNTGPPTTPSGSFQVNPSSLGAGPPPSTPQMGLFGLGPQQWQKMGLGLQGVSNTVNQAQGQKPMFPQNAMQTANTANAQRWQQMLQQYPQLLQLLQRDMAGMPMQTGPLQFGGQ